MLDVDADNLRLPGKSCASYMRAYEMPMLTNLQNQDNYCKLIHGTMEKNRFFNQ